MTRIKRRSFWEIPTLAALATVVAFLPTFDNGFVGWDDPIHFLNVPGWKGLGWGHIRWMFTALHLGLYHPLSWLSLGLDYTLWGLEPFGYHLTSTLIHAANSAIVYVLAKRLIAAAYSSAAGPDAKAPGRLTEARPSCLALCSIG